MDRCPHSSIVVAWPTLRSYLYRDLPSPFTDEIYEELALPERFR